MSYTLALRRAVKFATALTTIDALGSILLQSIGVQLVESIGDLLLLEAGVLFVLAGIVDFGSSMGITQFKRALLGSKEAYSPANRRKAEHTAAFLAGTGAILFALLLLIGLVRLVF